MHFGFPVLPISFSFCFNPSLLFLTKKISPVYWPQEIFLLVWRRYFAICRSLDGCGLWPVLQTLCPAPFLLASFLSHVHSLQSEYNTGSDDFLGPLTCLVLTLPGSVLHHLSFLESGFSPLKLQHLFCCLPCLIFQLHTQYTLLNCPQVLLFVSIFKYF